MVSGLFITSGLKVLLGEGLCYGFAGGDMAWNSFDGGIKQVQGSLSARC